MRLLRCYLLSLFLLFPALGCAQKDTLQRVAEPSGNTSEIVLIPAEQEKKKFEFVDINGEKFAVPQPWRGNRIQQESPPLKDLKKIPVDFTYEGTSIYIGREACDAFVQMAETARLEDVHLLVHSGYRSVRYQRKIFSKLMAEGRTWEDLIRYIAPPGYSEHMLGNAVDLYPSNWRFASTKEYSWLKKHAHEFGFFETFPEKGGKGYPWEAWHWNYSKASEKVSD